MASLIGHFLMIIYVRDISKQFEILFHFQSIKVFMRGVKSRRQTTGGLTELSITNCKQEMATVHVSFDSDDEFEFFMADKVRQAKMRDLEKAFEAAMPSQTSQCSMYQMKSPVMTTPTSTPTAKMTSPWPISRVCSGQRFCGRSLLLNFQEEHRTKMDGSKTELDILDLLLMPSFYEHIAKQTNTYTRKQLAAGTQWSDMSANEVKASLVRIVMGILQAPAQDMDWLKDRLFHPSCLEQKFARSLFENIQSFFHVADRARTIGHDKLTHVRHILENVRLAIARCQWLKSW